MQPPQLMDRIQSLFIEKTSLNNAPGLQIIYLSAIIIFRLALLPELTNVMFLISVFVILQQRISEPKKNIIIFMSIVQVKISDLNGRKKMVDNVRE